LGNFLPVGLNLEANYDFLRLSSPQKRYPDFKFLTKTCSYKTWFVVIILGFRKLYGVDVLNFKNEPCLETVLAIFLQNWVIFNFNLLVTLTAFLFRRHR
jgi:hypothetical protein